ncbi:MAG: hypothetical protein JW702_08005 [Clostridiales bacterium]|nr:hypothetical protein [Clostridiales bacterium]
MTLDNFFQPKKNSLDLKSAIKRMRSVWLTGPVDRFDLKLSRILGCNLEKAAKIREMWVDCGFLGFNDRGLLVWRNVRV